MPIVRAKPTSPGRRFVEKVVHPHLYKGRPFAALQKASQVVVTIMAALLLVTLAVVISNIIALSISNVLKTISQQR